MNNRVSIMHGPNFDVLERRDPEHYGGLTLAELEVKIRGFASDLGLEARPVGVIVDIDRPDAAGGDARADRRRSAVRDGADDRHGLRDGLCAPAGGESAGDE